jgi:phospholipid/cholesterol/gamma-HCH transport system substrate-binding protein
VRRGGVSTLAASPTMVGAVTVLIVIVAVFLAYNANTGLPFVPTYRVSADVQNANALVKGNEVRIGGVRVGMVEKIEPVAHEDGSVTARLDLKLDKDVEPLPVDSTLIVRSRSALGLKYLEINEGTSDEGYPPGATVPLSAATPEPVEIDEVLNTFDEPTRLAIQENLFEFGNALAGRGPDLNETIADLPPVLERLEPVARNLSDPSTGLGQFVDALSATAAEVAPVAEQQAQMFVSLNTTFAALATVARPFIQETISESPPTLDVTTATLPRIRPFLRHSADLFTDLGPGVEALRTTAPTLASALEVGTPALRAAPKLNRELAPTAESLLAFQENPVVAPGLARLTQTNDIFGPTLRFLTPAQTVCNYGTLLFRNAAGVVGEGGASGNTWQRFVIFQPPTGPNNEGSPSSGPANGGGDPLNFLHVNPYPNTAAPGQSPKECEAGNEPYLAGRQVIGHVPGKQGTVTSGQEAAE